jgi:hypothetical protein
MGIIYPLPPHTHKTWIDEEAHRCTHTHKALTQSMDIEEGEHRHVRIQRGRMDIEEGAHSHKA